MKKVKKGILALCVLMLVTSIFGVTAMAMTQPGSTPTAVLPHTGVVRTQGSALNVRSGPGTNHPVAGAIANNSHIVIIGRATNGWLRVFFDRDSGRTGYVSPDWVNQTLPWMTRIFVTTASALNFRRQVTQEVLTTIPRNGVVSASLNPLPGGQWHVVRWRAMGEVGWVSPNYLRDA